MKPLVVLGGGGHARVIIDAARAGVAYEPIAVLDPALSIGNKVQSVPVQGGDDELPRLLREFPGLALIVGIGDNTLRFKISAKLAEHYPNLVFASIFHPSSILSADIDVEPGTFIAAGVIINCGSRVGAHAIVNTGAVIDHDAELGAGSFIGPNATLSGNVRIGARSMLGAGATIIPGAVIGSDCIIGAGAVVISDVPDGCKAVGVPARAID